jgi:GNAT superfamily N-acetyltransferase
MLSVQVEQELKPSECEVLKVGMRRYIEEHVAWERYDDLTVVLRDEDGQFLGAALGETGRGWLHISIMWVDETVRRQGFGQELLESMETVAYQRGCRQAFLDTFSYQAKPFYERFGYHIFGTLDDYPEGHSRYFMTKRLQDG